MIKMRARLVLNLKLLCYLQAKSKSDFDIMTETKNKNWSLKTNPIINSFIKAVERKLNSYENKEDPI